MRTPKNFEVLCKYCNKNYVDTRKQRKWVNLFPYCTECKNEGKKDIRNYRMKINEELADKIHEQGRIRAKRKYYYHGI